MDRSEKRGARDARTREKGKELVRIYCTRIARCRVDVASMSRRCRVDAASMSRRWCVDGASMVRVPREWCAYNKLRPCICICADSGFSVSCLFLSVTAISVCLHAVGRSDTKIYHLYTARCANNGTRSWYRVGYRRCLTRDDQRPCKSNDVTN